MQRNDLEMAQDCVRHARMFFNRPDFDLASAVPGSFALTPHDGMIGNPRKGLRSHVWHDLRHNPTFQGSDGLNRRIGATNQPTQVNRAQSSDSNQNLYRSTKGATPLCKGSFTDATISQPVCGLVFSSLDSERIAYDRISIGPSSRARTALFQNGRGIALVPHQSSPFRM